MLDLTLSKNAVSSCVFVYKEHFPKKKKSNGVTIVKISSPPFLKRAF